MTSPQPGPTSREASERVSIDGDEGYTPLGGLSDDQTSRDRPAWERWGGYTADFLSSAQSEVYRAVRAGYFYLHPPALAHEILRELCNLPRRIQNLRATKLCLYGIEIGRLQGNHVDQRANERTRACMRDMREIDTFHPRATLLDRQLFVEGWKRGAEWASGETRNPQPGSTNKDQVTLSNSGNSGGNSMPPLDVQQPTKHEDDSEHKFK